MTEAKATDEEKLVKLMAKCRHDPVAYAKVAYPWNSDFVSKSEGMRTWQNETLGQIRDHLKDPKTRFTPLLIAVASGHGIGKSSLISIVTDWAMSTCTDCKIVTTANTEVQLRTKTWPEVQKWSRMCITNHWFNVTATAMASRDPKRERTWRADAIAWSETNTESFAGLHNKGRRIVLIFDEACHDDQTEVMTETGWKFFKDLTGEEKLLTMNDDGVAEYLRPDSLHASHRNGEMISYEIRGTSFLVTPNHRMLVQSRSGSTSFREAGELASKKNLEVMIPREFQWMMPDLKTIAIPAVVTNRSTWEERSFDADTFIELMGW
jgi:hypothetical protein